MRVNLTIGLMTLPLKAILYVACGIASLTLEQLSKENTSFIVAQFITLMIITYLPDLFLFLPRLLGFA